MMAKSPKNKASQLRNNRDTRKLWIVCGLPLLAKLMWLYSLPSHGLLGADGENYLAGVKALESDGVFSNATVLHYWPAGYPILLWLIGTLSPTFSMFIAGTLQSALFAFATFYFAKELKHSSISKYAFSIALVLTASPTLSLNSVVIGYEVTCASLLLIAITLLIKNRRLKSEKPLASEMIWANLLLTLACFMQPRILLLAVGIVISFAILSLQKTQAFKFLVVSVCILSISPISLVTRNVVANDFAAISTNLGVTMNIGAGDKATGGYSNEARGVSCDELEGNAAQKDQHLVACVLKWYVENPGSAIPLFYRKFIFHWSPWFGPLTNGTMARNPWLNFHPLVDVARNSESGFNMVFGNTGKIVSWIWEISSLILLLYGFLVMRRKSRELGLIAWMLFTPVVLNSISSMATIGDNRFRIPTLTFSVVLQILGIYGIIQRRQFRKS